MSSTPSTPSKLSSQSSGSEKTPTSGTSCNKRGYTKIYNSPTLRAFNTFEDLLEKLVDYVRKKIDHKETDIQIMLGTELDKVNTKCESMIKDFKRSIEVLKDGIKTYEKKKPADLVVAASSVTSPEARTVKVSSLFKDKNTIDEIFFALNECIAEIGAAIGKKINRAIYVVEYSVSMQKKLENLKEMCELKINKLELTKKMIKEATDGEDKMDASNRT